MASEHVQSMFLRASGLCLGRLSNWPLHSNITSSHPSKSLLSIYDCFSLGVLFYRAFPLCQGKLHLVKGQTVLLPCSLEYGFFESGSMQVLHLSCMAALVPRVRSGRKVPADQCCACVNVS